MSSSNAAVTPAVARGKAIVLDHLAACVTPGGKIFGSTLLAEGVQKSKLATGLMAKYNARHFPQRAG